MEVNSKLDSNQKFNVNSLILVWAFAECGIGGILHALRLPFTGIFVGGIAVICIVLIVYYSENGRKKIPEALAIVLLVKLSVSPHSPWQAYIAVIFQGYLGWFMFKNLEYFRAKVFLFSVICLLESAFQKIFISLIVYGMDFIQAIDKAGEMILKSVGLTMNGSIMLFVFCFYCAAHLCVGVLLGWWIPLIPGQLEKATKEIPLSFVGGVIGKYKKDNILKSLLLSFLLVLILLIALYVLSPNMEIVKLIFIFCRVIAISLFLIFIVGPILKKIIERKLSTVTFDRMLFNSVLNDIPQFGIRASGLISWAHNEFRGIKKLKMIILGLLVISLRMSNRDE